MKAHFIGSAASGMVYQIIDCLLTLNEIFTCTITWACTLKTVTPAKQPRKPGQGKGSALA